MAESYYIVQGNPAATPGAAGEGVVQVWNPSSVRTIELVEARCCQLTNAPNTSYGVNLRRSTARGTPGSTITPTAEHHSRREAAPDSGFLVDLAAFSVQPTLAAGNLGPSWRFQVSAALEGFMFPIPEGIEIPPSTGLVFVTLTTAGIATGEWVVHVRED